MGAALTGATKISAIAAAARMNNVRMLMCGPFCAIAS
jgi:hypothetical protein